MMHPNDYVTHKGIWYFKSYSIAKEVADEWLSEWYNIVYYTRGWAIQLRKSGPYAGPHIFD